MLDVAGLNATFDGAIKPFKTSIGSTPVAAVILSRCRARRGFRPAPNAIMRGCASLPKSVAILLITDGSAHRAQRTAVRAVTASDLVPHALLHNLKHNQVRHETNDFLNVRFPDYSIVDAADRVELTMLAPGF